MELDWTKAVKPSPRIPAVNAFLKRKLSIRDSIFSAEALLRIFTKKVMAKITRINATNAETI